MFEDEEEEFPANFDEDIARFERYLEGAELGFLDGDRIEMLIDHYLIQGAYSKAKACAEVGMSHFPFNMVFTLRKAQAISAMGQLKEALQLLAKYEQLEATNCEFLLTKAAIFSQLKDSKQAIKYFKEALLRSDWEDKDEIYLDLAMEYQQLNDYISAIKILHEAIKQNPKNEGAIYELAYCYDVLQEMDKAIQCYCDFIDENPYSYTAWYNLGNAYSKLENYEKAIWAYDYCILINESFSPAYFNLGNAYLAIDKFQVAIDSFEKCMELDGEDGLAMCYIGECYEQLGNYDLAKHYYHRSIEFIPELPEAWLGLGIVHDLEDNTTEGIRLIQQAIAYDPKNGSFYHVLAGAYEKDEQNEEANRAYLQSIELDNSNEEALTDYISFLSDLGQGRDALNYLEDADLAPSLSFTKELIVINLYWKEGRKEEALSKLIFCISEDETKAKNIFSLYPELQNESKMVNLFSN